MKRIYIAVIFLIISLAVGIVEFTTITSNVDKYLDSIVQISELVKEDKIEKAEKLSKKTAESFENYSKSIMFCYYRHDELEEIIETLYSLEDLLHDKRIDDYHEMSDILKKKLLSAKEKEQITFQNIL